MLSDLALMLESVMNTMTQVFNLYTGTIVLTGVLALWLLRKVVRLFRHLSGKEEIAMADLLATLGTVATSVLTYVGNVCATIVAQPLLLLTVGFLFIGGVIGIFGRLLSRS